MDVKRGVVLVAGCLLAAWIRPPASGCAEPSERASRHPPLELPYALDLDAYLEDRAPAGGSAGSVLEWLPRGRLYPAYLAAPKASRFSSQLVNARGDGWLWDATLGTRVGLMRLASADGEAPWALQIDAEGAAQVRLDPPQEVQLRSGDYRGGVLLAMGSPDWQTKLAYYHLSSHLGDEFLLTHPGFVRLNYSRDALVLGQSVYVTPRLRLYGEVGWAMASDVSEPWEFQFGADWAPAGPTGWEGEPFLAINGHLRQEVDFGGALTVQAGWAWRADPNGALLRIGLEYHNGQSPQLAFYRRFEEHVAVGAWWDY